MVNIIDMEDEGVSVFLFAYLTQHLYESLLCKKDKRQLTLFFRFLKLPPKPEATCWMFSETQTEWAVSCTRSVHSDTV